MLRRRFGRQDLIAEDGDGPDALMGDAGNDAIFGNGGNDMVTAGSNLLDDGLAGTTVKSITAEDDWKRRPCLPRTPTSERPTSIRATPVVS